MSCQNCKNHVPIPPCRNTCDIFKQEELKRKARKQTIYENKMVDMIANSVQVENCLRTQHKKGGQR